LSRKLAAANHYPAIDVLHSVSRVMDKLIEPEHKQSAAAARRLLAKHQEIEVLLQMGEYEAGADPLADAAITCTPRINRHLCQTVDESPAFAESLASLRRSIATDTPS
jgi:ATP synthase in type III secretion protein N